MTTRTASITETPDRGLQPTQLFQGYDTFADSGRRTAVTGTSRGPTAVRKETVITFCTDFESLQNTLEITASMSASLGLASMSTKMQFVHDLKITNTSVAVVVRTTIKSTDSEKTAQLDNVPSDVRQFFRSYGDSYVNQITTGAEYSAIYLIQCTTTEEKTQVTTELNGSGLLEGVQVDASFQMGLTNLRKTFASRHVLRQYMDGISGLEFPKAENIATFALKFGKMDADSPGAVISYGVAGYEDVASMPEPFDVIVANRKLFLGDATNEGVAKDYARITKAANAAEQLSGIYETYGYAADVDLGDRAVQLVADARKLAELVDSIEADPTAPYFAPPLPSLAFGWPQLNAVVQQTQSWGGSSDGAVEFTPVGRSTIPGRVLLSNLHARIGLDQKDMLQFFHSYVLDVPADDGSVVVYLDLVNGTDTNGNESPTFTLMRGERITDVEVEYFDHVHKLAFRTTAGRIYEAPVGQPNPVTEGPGHWTEGPNDRLLGFAGWSHDWVRSLAVIYATFAPAVWQGGVTTTRKPASARPRLQATA